jgi:hypothetical protein
MNEYEELRDTIDVPRGTGIQGFLRAIEEILKQPRVQEVKIDSRGKVSYLRYLRKGEANLPLSIDFDTLQPYAILRNARDIVEITGVSPNASMSLLTMFRTCSRDKLFPVAFIGGANTVLFEWHKKTTGVVLDVDQDAVLGYPFYRDHLIEDPTLFLAAAYSRNAALVDVQRAYKMLMPARELPIKLDEKVTK